MMHKGSSSLKEPSATTTCIFFGRKIPSDSSPTIVMMAEEDLFKPKQKTRDVTLFMTGGAESLKRAAGAMRLTGLPRSNPTMQQTASSQRKSSMKKENSSVRR